MTLNAGSGQVDRTSYLPFGLTRAGSVPTDYRFTGQRLDGTGLYDFGARSYDPALGRFLSPDSIVPKPMNPQDLNRYSYVRNGPLKYVDPSGHWPPDANAGLDFLSGVLEEYLYANSFQLATALAVQPNESMPKTVGRYVGDGIATFQGIGEMAAGAAGDLGGGALCLSGAGCVVGAPAIGASTALGVHGALLAFSGAGSAGKRIGQLAEQVRPHITKSDDPSIKKAPRNERDFGDEGLLNEHYEKHGGEMGYDSPQDYLENARRFTSGDKNTQAYVRKSGETVFYKRSTNEYAVLSADGKTIKTYMKPDPGYIYFLEDVWKDVR